MSAAAQSTFGETFVIFAFNLQSRRVRRTFNAEDAEDFAKARRGKASSYLKASRNGKMNLTISPHNVVANLRVTLECYFK